MSTDKTTTYLECPGVGRDADYDRSLVLYFNRRPSDEEMRRVHAVVKRFLETDTKTIHAVQHGQ